MFGNRLGWTISLVMWAVAGWILWSMGKAAGVAPPTAFGRAAATYTIELPIEPQALAYFMTEPGDSGPLYMEALAEFRRNQDAFERVKGLADAPVLAKGLDLFMKAGRMKSGGVFRDDPKLVINYDPYRENLEQIKLLGRAAAALAKYHGDAGHTAEARALYEAVFALGAKMYEERLSYWELDVANEPLELGARALAKLDEEAGEIYRANRFRDFSKQRVEFMKNNVIKVRNGIWALEPHVGDMIAIAENGGDPMWRVDAILALGRCQYSTGKFGDQQGAVMKINQLTQSTEPRIRTAAEAAKNLKIEDFRRLR